MQSVLHSSICNYKLFLLSISVCFMSNILSAQTTITGTVTDATSAQALPFVNIGIKNKNIGTVSSGNGNFSIHIPAQNSKDTVTFSIVGYNELNLPVNQIVAAGQKIFQLQSHPAPLEEVVVSSKLVEKKIGMVNHPLIHFTDGSTNQNDIFEIAQLIKLGNIRSKITSVNLTLTDARADSGIFRINFYEYDGRRPANRIVEKSIVQTHAIKPGLLTFDLRKYNIYLRKDFVIGIEFLPAAKPDSTPINYEVKIGGSSKSFVRSASQGNWRVPPHHYRLFITTLVNANAKPSQPQENEEVETAPSLRLYSANVKDSFSVFVRLPKNYNDGNKQNYPLVLLLDANAYFDIAGNSITEISKQHLVTEPLLVGVGYKDFIQNDSMRSRDYTYPVAPATDSFTRSGGADKFLLFIQNELLPVIDKNYRTDTVNRTIMGHSLGGYFTLYALQRALAENNRCFNNFIAASPSLHYDDYYIVKQLINLPLVKETQNKQELLITMGGEEIKEAGADSIRAANDFESMIKTLSGNRFVNLKIKSRIYPGFSHMETAIPTFEDGLRHLLKLDEEEGKR